MQILDDKIWRSIVKILLEYFRVLFYFERFY